MTHLIPLFVTAAGSQVLRAAPIVGNALLSGAPLVAYNMKPLIKNSIYFSHFSYKIALEHFKTGMEERSKHLTGMAIIRLAFMGVAAYFNIATGSGLGAGLGLLATVNLLSRVREYNKEADKFMRKDFILSSLAIYILGFAAGDACELGARLAFARFV